MSDELGELRSVMDSLRSPIYDIPEIDTEVPPQDIIPPSNSPISPDIMKSIQALKDLALKRQFEALMQELEARRSGYEFFPYEEERREIVQIASRLVDYVDDHDITSLVLLDRSARPVYIGFNEAWKRKHGESPDD